MTTQIRYATPRKVRGLTPQNSPSYTIVANPTGNVSGQATVRDAVFNTQTGTKNNFKVVVGGVSSADKVSFASTTPATVTIDASGNATYVSNGTGTIDIMTSRSRLGYSQAMANAGSSSIFSNFLAGTAAASIDTAIKAMVSGKTSGAATQSVFSAVTVPGTTGTNVTRNAGIFTGALDLTAISVSTDNSGCDEYPVVLISPYHVMCGHYGVSGNVVFKDSAGNYQTRTVLGTLGLASNTGSTQSNFVGILSSAVSTITPMAFLPTTYATQLPSFAAGNPIPLLNKGWTAGDYIRVLTTVIVNSSSLNLRAATDSTYSSWSSPIIGGDSNGPVFVPINGVPALLGCMNTPVGCVMLPNVLTDIQAKMNSLSTTYSSPAQTLVPVSLSGFPSP